MTPMRLLIGFLITFILCLIAGLVAVLVDAHGLRKVLQVTGAALTFLGASWTVALLLPESLFV